MTSPFILASLILTDVITEKVNILLSKVINCWDFGQIEIRTLSDGVDVSQFDFSQIEENKIMWEDVAKLSINLIVDYEYYRQFSFKSRYKIMEYNDRLLKLGYILKNDRWKSVRKPEIKNAEMNIFMYFLYCIILDKMSLTRDNDQNKEMKMRHLKLTEDGRSTNGISVEVLEGSGGTFSVPDTTIINRCSFCDNEILYLETKCNTCDAAIEDIQNYLIALERKNKNKCICGRCNTENDCTSDHCRGCRSENNNIKMTDDDNGGRDNGDEYYGEQDGGDRKGGDADMVDVSGGDNNMVDRRGCDDWMKDDANVKKWKCGGCGLLNEYSVLTCTACYGLYEDGRWVCGQCTTENSGDKDYCSVCKERNVNNINTSGAERRIDVSYKSALVADNIDGKSDIVERDKETHTTVDEWRCGVCMMRQSYKYILCESCNRRRDVSGEWVCTKCTMVNKCDTDNCTMCNEWNDNLPRKICQYCRENKVAGPKIRCEDCVRNKIWKWKCGYRKCGRGNDDNDEYCYKCSYWRHNTYGRGDECKQKGRLYGTKNGWICVKCDTFNDLNKTDCSKYACGETRYLKILCNKCQNYNDHILTNCWKCRNQLR